jgi:transcription initiation factor TFIIF subunit beta
MSTIKTEDGAHVKAESEVDEYEDTGECQMPTSQEEQDAWLVKLPKWLWQAWASIDDDEQIELGRVRVYEGQKVKLRLHDIAPHRDVPKHYDLTMTREKYNNTVVFSERDQPGFKAWNPNRVRRDNHNKDNYRVNKTKSYTSSIPSAS